MKKSIKQVINILKSSADLNLKLAETGSEKIVEAADCITESLKSGGKVLICGNGGSAADSQHIAAEFTGRFLKERKALPAIALTTDSSVLTAVGNDYGFNMIFSRQVEALGRCGDVLVGISTSGKSENVILALKKAKELNMKSIVFTGSDSNCPMAQCSDIVINVPSTEIPRIQEVHITIGHIICDLVENRLF